MKWIPPRTDRSMIVHNSVVENVAHNNCIHNSVLSRPRESVKLRIEVFKPKTSNQSGVTQKP